MTLLNYIIDNGFFFYAGFSTVGIALTWSLVRQVYINPNSNLATLETPTTDTGVDTLRALSSSTLQPTPTIQQFSFDQLEYVESHMDIGVQANLFEEGRSLESALQVMTQDLNNLQSKIDYLTQALTQNISNLHSILPQINAVQAYPDHPNYLIYLLKNPTTNTVMDIVANNSIF